MQARVNRKLRWSFNICKRTFTVNFISLGHRPPPRMDGRPSASSFVLQAAKWWHPRSIWGTNCLRWCVHVMRAYGSLLSKIDLNIEVNEKWPKGRPKQWWVDALDCDLKASRLRSGDQTLDRAKCHNRPRRADPDSEREKRWLLLLSGSEQVGWSFLTGIDTLQPSTRICDPSNGY